MPAGTLVVSPRCWVRMWHTPLPSLILCLRCDSSRACAWIRVLYFLWGEEGEGSERLQHSISANTDVSVEPSPSLSLSLCLSLCVSLSLPPPSLTQAR